jgi:hypothetical protein
VKPPPIPIPDAVQRLIARIHAQRATNPNQMGTIKDVERITGLRESAIRDQKELGHLLPVKMGGATRYDLDEATEWKVDCILMSFDLKPGKTDGRRATLARERPNALAASKAKTAAKKRKARAGGAAT